MNVDTVTRANFIKNLVDAGFTYVQAASAFECMIKTIEDGVCTGSKVNFGKVGSLTPVKLAPRPVTMGFVRGKGDKIEKTSRTYYLGSRIRYKFVLFKGFMNTHTIQWNLG